MVAGHSPTHRPGKLEWWPGTRLHSTHGLSALNHSHPRPRAPVAAQLVLALDGDQQVQLHAALYAQVLVLVRAVRLGAELRVLHLGAAASQGLRVKVGGKDG